ncbi:MAG: hypothetical protein A2Y40_03525 [Candidatus Margulisbacteria bacterium GWF2_35_9]|nr:MAG: hypothetical protein A2Y40_03525 [Candidatus Margulisbacteria bacterium GWF2_35_9]
MKKIVFLCLLMTIICVADDKNFILPDLFVTAKDIRMLDEGSKSVSPISKSWKAINYINKDQGYLSSDKNILEKINLDEVANGMFFNEAQFSVGLPSYLSFSIYHGYEWEKKPYFIILNRTIGDREYSAYTKETGEFFVAMAISDKNIINLKMLEHNIGSAKLNSIQGGWRTFWNIPITYQVKLFNAGANATAGNPAISYFQNNLSLDIGEVSILNTTFPSQVNVDLLNSNNNAYTSIELLLNKTFDILSAPNSFQFGVNAWANKGTMKIGFSLNDKVNFQLTKNVQIDAGLNLSNTKVKVDDMFTFDLAEMNDPKLEPDEKAEISITVNNYFHANEQLMFSYVDYANLKVWDDVDNDGYFSRVNAKNVQILKLGALLKDLVILSENIDVLVQLPIYNKDIPNQFTKFSEVTYKKTIYSGMLSVVGSYYLRELGKTAVYKNAYFDMDINYNKSVNANLWWGFTIGNLLSSGAEKVTGLKIGAPYVYLKLRLIF